MDKTSISAEKWDRYHSKEINIYLCGRISSHGKYITTAKDLYEFLKSQ
jgi:hypothetical protein